MAIILSHRDIARNTIFDVMLKDPNYGVSATSSILGTLISATLDNVSNNLGNAENFWDPVVNYPQNQAKDSKYISLRTKFGWKINYIYRWDKVKWVEIKPEAGFIYYLNSSKKYFYFDGSKWKELTTGGGTAIASAHSNTHTSGGSDQINISRLSGFTNYIDQSVKSGSNVSFGDTIVNNLDAVGITDENLIGGGLIRSDDLGKLEIADSTYIASTHTHTAIPGGGNIDGGRADEVYVTEQCLDGGSA